MSAHLIGFGCDIQQKLDSMDPKTRKARWAGDVGVALYRIAQRLHRLSADQSRLRSVAVLDRAERELIEQAQHEVNKLGVGIVVIRQPDPLGRPMVIVFPGDVPKGSTPETAFEMGVAVPPQP